MYTLVTQSSDKIVDTEGVTDFCNYFKYLREIDTFGRFLFNELSKEKIELKYRGIEFDPLNETVYFFDNLEYITLFKLKYHRYILRESQKKSIQTNWKK